MKPRLGLWKLQHKKYNTKQNKFNMHGFPSTCLYPLDGSIAFYGIFL